MTREFPRQVTIPPQSVVGDEPVKRLCWEHLRNSAADLGIDVVMDASLPAVCWSAFEFVVDGALCVCDYSDFLVVDSACGRYEHWLRFQYTRSFVPCPNIGSFPPISFLDWPRYRTLSQTMEYRACGDAILHKQFFPPSMTPTGFDLHWRRSRVQADLVAHFGALVDTKLEPQEVFWGQAAECLASVHVPGSYQHSLDRAQHQLMGLGVCTVSPDIWTATLQDRPERDVHYVGCRDDYSDLPARIEWCRSHRDECAAIGRRAKRFFIEHSTPEAIWSYIQRRVTRAD